MVSSGTVFWLLLASLLVLQVLAEVGSPAGNDEHALDRLKRSPVPSSSTGNSHNNSHNNSHGKSHGNSHGKKPTKKSSTKGPEKSKSKPKSNAKRTSADHNRRSKTEQSKKSTVRPKPH